MSMISVQIRESGDSFTLKVDGHAGAAEAGKDIVCAAASMLTFTAAQSARFMKAENKLRRKPEFRQEQGDAELVVKPKKAYMGEARVIFRTVLTGYLLLAQNYPEYVQVVS